MTETMDKATSRRGPTGKQTTFGGLVLAFVIALYAYGQPILNERMGWNLPALPKTSSTEVAEAKTATKTVSQPKSAEPSTSTNADAAKPTEPEREIAVPTPTKTLAPKTDPPKSLPGPLAVLGGVDAAQNRFRDKAKTKTNGRKAGRAGSQDQADNQAGPSERSKFAVRPAQGPRR